MNLSDPNDIASKFESEDRDRCIAAARARANGQGRSNTECGECGDPIPEKRQEIIRGCKNCALCAEETGVS